ncbi:MAG: ATP-grasp domain-containing protein [Ornithinimicrobium sp.]
MTVVDGGATPRRVVLITGAGGAAAVTLILALRDDHDVIAADLDPLAVGLYLVPEGRRVLLPRGDDPDFADTVLREAHARGAHLVIPTVDVELPHISGAAQQFHEAGIRLLVESPETLQMCLDKWQLMQACASSVRVPASLILHGTTYQDAVDALGTPFIVKPRSGAGGRGFAVVESPEAFLGIPSDGSILAQEHLPGEEFSIDVLAQPDGHIVAAVPRRRDKVDSGIAVAGRTVDDPDLVHFGRSVAQAIGVRTVVNVQAKRALDGSMALLEVNPRFPGTMSLTMAAGVDMPRLATGAAFGDPVPEHVDFAEVAVVRHWAEVAVPVSHYPTTGSPDNESS